jgi:hypothetical protein
LHKGAENPEARGIERDFQSHRSKPSVSGTRENGAGKKLFLSMTIADGTQSTSLVRHYSVVLERYAKLLTNHGVKPFMKRAVFFRAHSQRDRNCDIGN